MTGRSRARDRSRPSGDVVQWAPTRLANLASWYRADGTLTGSPVSSWTESGGRTGTATQGTVASQPAAPAARAAAGNQKASRFDGGDFLTSTADVDCSSGVTAITVVEFGALKNFQALLRLASHESNNVSGGICVYGVSTGALAVRNCDAGSSWYRTYAAAISGSTAHAMILRFGGSFATLSLEIGTISGSSLTWVSPSGTGDVGAPALPAASGNKLILGAGWSDVGGLLNGYEFEQIVVNRVIDASEVSAVKAYLKSRYAP